MTDADIKHVWQIIDDLPDQFSSQSFFARYRAAVDRRATRGWCLGLLKQMARDGYLEEVRDDLHAFHVFREKRTHAEPIV